MTIYEIRYKKGEAWSREFEGKFFTTRKKAIAFVKGEGFSPREVHVKKIETREEMDYFTIVA